MIRKGAFWKIGRFIYGSLLLKRTIPLIASFKLTYRCNLSCLACPFHLRAHEAGANMDKETALSCLDSLAGRGCPIVVFEGGEPLLWKDRDFGFSDLAQYARKRFACVAVTTNGTYPLDVPADIVWVSIDGTRKTHNLLRSGSFDQVMENLGATGHKKVFAHLTLNRLNKDDIPGIIPVLSAIPAIKGITVQLFYPYHQGEQPLSLTKEERCDALRQILSLKSSGYPVMNSSWSLKAMMGNTWPCRADLLANVNPDGAVSTGCYVKSRGKIDCSQCGFTPVAEASGACRLIPGSIMAGFRIFLSA
jgi:MoaA/NifB/PqqE/SkfB family radical SAM enzyme